MSELSPGMAMACLPATWLTVQIAFDTDRGSEHYRTAPAPARNAQSQDGPRSGAPHEEDLGGARRPRAIAEDDASVASVSGQRAEFLFFCPQQRW